MRSSHTKRIAFGASLLIAISAISIANPDKKQATSTQELSGARKVDEFNASVKDKTKGDGEPVRGGSIRIRIPIEPQSLNRIIENGAQARTITSVVLESFIERNFETFEWLPRLAHSWEQRDVVELAPAEAGGARKILEGLVLERTKKHVVFSEGGTLITLGRHDLKSLDLEKGEAKTKDLVFDKKAGRVYQGTLTENGDTVKLKLDMAWLKAEEKTFAKADVVVEPSKTYKGKIEYGLAGNDKSYTVKIAVLGKEATKIEMAKIAVDEKKSGKRVTKSPAVKQQVVTYFHMRKGVRWHDNEPVSVNDVKFSFETIRNTSVDCGPLRAYYIDIKDCRITGTDTIRFEYAKQYFRSLSFCGQVPILPRHRYQYDRFSGDPEGYGKHFNKHPDNRKPIGCGPFKFAEWTKGQKIKVVRNENYYIRHAGLPYYHPDRPYLDSISWIVVNNKDASIKQLKKGEIDADFDIEPLTWRDKDNQTEDFKSKIVRAQFLQPLYTYIGWNQKRPNGQKFFQDVNVRRAMTMLIDRETILNEIHGGLGEIVNGPFYRYGPFHNKKVKTLAYNPERAKVLLDKAGWIDHDGDGIRDKDGVKFEFDYLIHNARAYHQKIADKIKESVEQAGISMSIRKIDWRVFQDTVRDHNFDAVRFAWGEPSCIETDPYQIWHSSQASERGSNYISFGDGRSDNLIERIRRELNFKKRQKMLLRFHKTLADQQPYTFLFNFYSLYFYNRRYRNVKFYIIGEEPYDLTEWYIPKSEQAKK